MADNNSSNPETGQFEPAKPQQDFPWQSYSQSDGAQTGQDASGAAGTPQQSFPQQQFPQGYQQQGSPQQGYQQQGYPQQMAQPYSQYAGAPQGQEKKSHTGLIIGLLVLALLIVGGLLLLSQFGSKMGLGQPTTSTVIETQTQESSQAGAAPAPASAGAPAPAAAPAPSSGGSKAGGNLSSAWANSSVTTEPFVESVRQAYVDYRNSTGQQSGNINAYSSVTGRTYSMWCRPSGGNILCTGGNNAQVMIGG